MWLLFWSVNREVLNVWLCLCSRASGVLPPAGRSSSVQGQSVCCGWSRGGHRLLVGRDLRSRHGYAGALKTGGRKELGSPWLFWTLFLLCFQVVGHKKGLDVMERADPLFLLMGLPTIPVMLVLGKMIRWEDYIVRLWQRHSSKLQIFSGLVPGMWTTALNWAVVHWGSLYLN